MLVTQRSIREDFMNYLFLKTKKEIVAVLNFFLKLDDSFIEHSTLRMKLTQESSCEDFMNDLH